MDRREFIKLATYTSIGTMLLPGCSTQPIQSSSDSRQAIESAVASQGELVVVQGSDPVGMLERGFAALGGIQNFVKPGNVVVIKPNFSVPRTPEEACTTNPSLVAGLVKMCKQIGAKEVRVIDHPFTNPIICLEKTGMKKAVASAGGKIYTLNDGAARYFQTVNLNGKWLQEVEYSKDVLEADVFINMPILKDHNITKLTMGLKNLMGLVWDRGLFHKADLDRCIAELAAYKKPSLTIMDALRGITAKGPIGPGPIKEYNQLIFGIDQLAVDAYGASLFGMKPARIDHLRIAAELGVGQLDWEKLKVKRV